MSKKSELLLDDGELLVRTIHNPLSKQRVSNTPVRYVIYNLLDQDRRFVLDTTNASEFDRAYKNYQVNPERWALTSCGETLSTGWEEWLSLRERLKLRFEWRFDIVGMERQRPLIAGGVYLVHGVDTPHYKIGRSNDPQRRVKNFGIKLPFDIEVICIVPANDPTALERELHHRFADKRAGGEWFALTPDDVEYIKSLAVQP